MNLEHFKKMLKLLRQIEQFENRAIEIGFKRSLNLLRSFEEKRVSEIQKLPYRLNILDDLNTNENAHSKFLIRLLQFKPALKNFISSINDNERNAFSFDIEQISKPKLNYEKLRIDGLIYEQGKYIIIIENKIHNAKEQEHQIGRYVDKCLNLGFSLNQIYVLYLLRTEKDSHSEQTWGHKYNERHFEHRYCTLSYRQDILFWLENFMKILNPSEELIRSAIFQYKNHLESIFSKNEKYKKMNLELQEFLSKELDLSHNQNANIEIVENKLEEINKLKVQLEQMLNNSRLQLFVDWRDKILSQYNLREDLVFNQSKDNFIKTGVIFEHMDKKFSVLIEYNYKAIYLGFGRHYSSGALENEIHDFLGGLISTESLKKDGDIWWYGWKYTTFNNGYDDITDLLNKTLLLSVAK